MDRDLTALAEDDLIALENDYDARILALRDGRRLVARERQRRSELQQMRAKLGTLSDRERALLAQEIAAQGIAPAAPAA